MQVPSLIEADEYDEIFAALKHPVRRQILLFLEEHGEASFTQIQNAVGIDDTGLMSYHLKELAPLIEQSERGKYRLSEVGEAGAELFQRVERERQRTSVTVSKEIDRYLSQAIVRSVLLLGTFALSLGSSMTVDILISVQGFLEDPSAFWLAGMFLVSLFGMLFGVALFAAYYRHYYSKNARSIIVYSTFFAIVVTLISSFTFYQLYLFSSGTLSPASPGSGIPWYFGVLRAVLFMASAPAVAYAVSKVKRR
jgi:DNA-binding transcriptional ArsR family regulator